jgi:hypothetical protein
MKRTGNTIVAKLFVGSKFQDVPIMRNGKPTKRTKREYVSEYADVELTGIEVQGHEIFINENEKHYNGDNTKFSAYNGEGERITVICKFGKSGKADHTEVAHYNVKIDQIVCLSSGFQGATGHGWGAYIKKINW